METAERGERAGAGPGRGRGPGERRRRRRIAVALAGLALAAVLVALFVTVWNFSSLVVVPDHGERPQDVTVEAVRPGSVVLSRNDYSGLPGTYALVWQGGRAVVGEVLRDDGDTVTRRLRSVDGYLVPGTEVAVDFDVWAGDPRQALGIPFRAVRYPSEAGPMPAWEVPGRSRTWAIVVHGINGDPQIGLRLLPTLRRAGMPTLLIGYREDLGAPSVDGKHHMGLTEWRDVQGAARYALRHGARRLVLVGYSMGGAIVSQFMQRSPLAERVTGLVLDAPALDWRQILAFNATEMGLPAFAAKPVEWMIGARIEVDWDSLDAARHRDAFRLPILLFHGTADEVVPLAVSEEFAAALPGFVDLVRVPDAGHVGAWNAAPRRYEGRLLAFLRSAAVGAAAGGGASGGAQARAPEREQGDGEQRPGPVGAEHDEEQAR